MKKIVLGLSGGVDSAVSAALLQQDGWTVYGLYLDIGTAGGRNEAQTVADALGIALSVEDITDDLEDCVCTPFTESYLRGETPNPCILCNPSVKFKKLQEHAELLGAEAIATGHYARTVNGALYRGRPANDQSYMLCRITRAQLAKLVLPLGGLEKQETRAMAARMDLPVAHKPDSMEICFIPDKDYCGWLGRRTALPGPGVFTRDGIIIGRHEGIHRWTVGQRIPGIYNGEKLFVRRIDAETGEITVCPDAELWMTGLEVKEFHWISDPTESIVHGSVKVRHSRTAEAHCTAYPTTSGGLRIVLEQPLRAPAPGQSAVLYDGERVLGGGFIVSSD